MEVAIARPSIVVGESGTGWTPAFNVLYWPLRAFARGLFDRIPARPDGRVDVVPVDYVADGIAALIDTDATGTFNLVAGEDATRVDELATLACAHFGRERPPYVETGASSGAAVDEHGAVYVPYFDMEVVFDDSPHPRRARAAGAEARLLLRHAARLRRSREVGQARHAAGCGRRLRRLPVGRLQRAVPLLRGRRGGAQHHDGDGDRGDDEAGADREGERVAARQRARVRTRRPAAAPRCARWRASPAPRGRPPRRPAAWC